MGGKCIGIGKNDAKTIFFLDMLCYGYTARTKKYVWSIEFSVPHLFQGV